MGGTPEPAIIPCDEFNLDNDEEVVEPVPDLHRCDRVRDGDFNGSPVRDRGAYELRSCPADCGGIGDGDVGIEDLLALLAQWGDDIGCCDINDDGRVGINDLLEFLALWGDGFCITQVSTGVPQYVEDCYERYGSDPERLAACLCIVEPCTEGCPPENCP